MITEKTINQILARFEENEFDYEENAQEFAEEQPAILSFLTSDHEGALLDEERDYMIYLATVIWRSVEHVGPPRKPVSAKQLAEAEEANWDLQGRAKGRTFRERLDVFFEKTPQEDLLAFIEDSLTPGEEDDEEDFPVTEEGAEAMFVMLKTVVDVLTAKGV